MSLTEAPGKTVQGGLIQLFPGTGLTGIANVVPNIVQFDINPSELTRNFTPWKVDTENDTPAPGAGVQPITVPQTFEGLTVILDPYAAKNSAIPINFLSVEARLAALQKMIEPAQGLLGDLVSSASDLFNIEQDYHPPELAPVILWLGARIILPVQVESFRVVEHQHDLLYYPTRATVTMNLKVMTPDQFCCTRSVVAEIAIATYEYTRTQQNLAAIVSAVDISPLWRLIVPV